jgi:hypothetical protein
MNRYCTGEHLNEKEIQFVSSVITYSHLKNEADLNFDSVNQLTKYYFDLLKLERFILDENYIDDISIDSLYSCFYQLNRDLDFENFSDFLLGLNLQIKEIYTFSEIHEAIEIKQIITQEKINMNLKSISDLVFKLNQVVDHVYAAFHNQS